MAIPDTDSAVASARIRPRPLTIFVGDSGSGKSFTAAALYSFARAGQELATALDGSSRFPGYPAEVARLVEQIASRPAAFLGQIKQGQPLRAEDDASFRDWIAGARDLLGNHLARAVVSGPLQLLGATTVAELQRFGATAPLAISVSEPDRGELKSRHQGAVIYSHLFVSPAGEPYFDLAWAAQWAERQRFAVGGQIADDHLGRVLASALLRRLALNFQERFGPPPLYLPAGRTGMASTGPFVERLLAVAHARQIELAGPASEFLEQYRLAGSAPDGSLSAEVDAVEAMLHGGRIDRRPLPTVVPTLDVVVDGNRIPMDRASSSVAELAPVTFMLRKLARQGTLAVLEEPEAHLHPAKQILLARALARLTNAGVRFVVTTHSELLVDMLGWILRATEAGTTAAAEIPECERLAPASVAVYRFGRSAVGDGYTAREIPFDPYDGFDRANWLDSSSDLFNRHAALTDLRAASTTGE